jgi:hypothetical protein
MRATTSVGPPAANGTTSEIGLSGNVWLCAGTPTASEVAAAQASSRVLNLEVICLVLMVLKTA